MDYFKLIDVEKLKSLSLYFHVPFCWKKCDYCAFYSIDDSNLDLQWSWLKAIKREIKNYSDLLEHFPVDTIFIGGGTPSVLKRPVLQEFLELVQTFNLSALQEYTIEANPESLTREFLEVCTDFSVNRLSLGIQSLHSTELDVLGRHVSLDQIEKALFIVKENWAKSLSFDLISGIPGQTEASLYHSLEILIEKYIPDHFSLYSLTPEEKTILAQRFSSQKINYHQNQDNLWTKGYYFLQKHGYLNYEIANFSAKGCSCVHNLAYWNLTPYLGIGPGAYSSLPGPKGPIRMNYPGDLDAFVKSSAVSVETLSNKDFLIDTLIMGWRLKKGIKKSFFKSRFGESLDNLLPEFYDYLIQSKSLLKHDEYYLLTFRNRLFLDSILMKLIAFLEKKKPDSFKLNWP